MKKLRWQIVIVIVALAAIGILLIGQQPIIQTIVPEAAKGGVYIEGLVGSPSRFNPLLDYFNQVDRDVDRLLYGRMVTFDAWGNPIPDLAESWGVHVDGNIFNVVLRENAVWHDGEPLTSEDVIFTIELLRNPDMPIPADLAALWSSVEVIAFDEYNLQFILPEPYSPFVDYLSFGILPKHLLDGKTPQEIIDDPLNLSPVGSGPYAFEELIVEEGQVVGVVLSAFEDYYLDRPNIDQIVFRYFNTTGDAISAYQDGEILGINSVGAEDLDAVVAGQEMNLYTARLPQVSLVLLNLDNSDLPFFEDVNVRKALMLALNRPWMIDQVLDGQAVVAHTPVFPGSWAYFDEIDRYAFDSAEAIRILKAEGYTLPPNGRNVRRKDGVSLSFDLVYPDTLAHTILAEMIKEFWEKIGVEAKLVAVPPGEMVSEYLGPRKYDAALVEFSLAGTPDPDPYPFWHQSQAKGGQNYSQWNDRRASEYLEQARTTPNHQERARLYRNFQVHFSRELPALPLYFPVYSYVVTNEIRGIQVPPLYDRSDRFSTILDWFLVAKPGIEEVEVGTEGP